MIPQKWTIFVAACILTVALVLPHAPLPDVLAGLALAGFVTSLFKS